MSKIGNSFRKVRKELKDGVVKLSKKVDKTIHNIEEYVDKIDKQVVLEAIDTGWHVAIDITKNIHPLIGGALHLADKAGRQVYKYVKIKNDKAKILKALESNIKPQIESEKIQIENEKKK